ncbi:MAG: YicC/YloC family endoribonuclease [Vicinamibacterales bacterium]
MIRSMTGFAAVSREDAGTRASVTVKSVNHRFLDMALKMPAALGALESRLKAAVQRRVTRGRVEIAIQVESIAAVEREVVIDRALLAELSSRLGEVRDAGLVTGGLSVSDLLRVPQLVEIRTRVPETPAGAEPVAAPLVEAVLEEATGALVAMRDTEGRFLAADLEARIRTLGGFVDALEAQAREGQAGLEARLREKLAALPGEIQADPAAAAQEIVRFVARSDVDEEVVRLRGHVEHWRALADGPEPCGRKLDFLVQEMNREINTIGSKIEGPRVSEVVIAAKAELERVREQVQNVE